MDHLDRLTNRFSSLDPKGKAMFLAKVAHHATVIARDAYSKGQDNTDGVALRTSNEFVHRVAGYTMHVLHGSEGAGQDRSVMSMIVEYFDGHGQSRHLAAWLL